VNRSISRLYVVVLLLFALLIVWTSRWTVFSANALNTNPLNRLGYFATLKVKRGRILAADGTVLARSVPAPGGTFTRTYPLGPLFAQTVGFSDIQQGQEAGLESEYARALAARQQTTLASVFGPISTSDVGDDIDTTLDPPAQTLARSLLAGRVGAVVAIVPQTGAIPVLYSNPTYNDNDLAHPCAQTQITDSYTNPGLQNECEFNLALQGQYAPGSTFKIVTSTAAINSGLYTPNSLINGHSPLLVSGTLLHNDADQSFGEVTLTEALTLSIDTVYAQVGEAVGAARLEEYMRRFGFYAPPPIDLPAGSATASGERSPTTGRLIPVSSPLVDLGRSSIGQSDLEVSPLQMAMVAATVANGGTLMKPHLVTRVVNPDGQVVESFPPEVYHHVMSAKTATEIGQMMRSVVLSGTGTAADLPGLDAAGKTGTASVIKNFHGVELDEAWFVAFAPVSDPKIAVAVMLRNIPNGYGGTYAAPIAAQMMKTLLGEGY
jgi:peptidoglycan glycosyltransferase